MLLEGRPLYDTAADRELYVPHEEFARAISATRRGFNVLIAGPRGSGKTSLLRQLQLALREDGAERAPVFVDATAAETPLVLIEHVREAMRGRPSELRVLAEQAAFAGGLLTQRAPGAASTYVVRLVRDLGAEAPQTIVIDATGAGAAIYGLFGRLRDELWQLPHRWVVAIDADELGAVLRPPADAFFDVVLRLRGSRPNSSSTSSSDGGQASAGGMSAKSQKPAGAARGPQCNEAATRPSKGVIQPTSSTRRRGARLRRASLAGRIQ